MDKISKELFNQTLKRWSPDNHQRGHKPRCGYCADQEEIKGTMTCNGCLCPKIICGGKKPLYSKWLHSGNETKDAFADKIYAELLKEKERLGY